MISVLSIVYQPMHKVSALNSCEFYSPFFKTGKLKLSLYK